MHALIHQYAELVRQLLQKKAGSAYAEQLIAYMKKHGHLSVLPAVLARVDALGAKKQGPEVVVARPSDAVTLAPRIAGALSTLGAEDEYVVRVDDRAVGGYMVRANGKVIDQSHRRALVELYQRVISK